MRRSVDVLRLVRHRQKESEGSTKRRRYGIAVWSNQFGDSNSLTCWAGQYFSDGNPEVIITVWLLRTETLEGQNWAATQVGEDVFYRSLQQATARKLTSFRAPAHPVGA